VSTPVVIDPAELQFSYARSSGPGGQHVNRVETRVTLRFDVSGSASLGDAEKRLISTRLAGRINKEGVLRVVSQRYRTREGNRRAALERFRELITEALKVRRRRKKTRVPRATKKRRLDSKRRRGELKRGRSSSSDD